jgi:acyl carrier protein
MAQLAESDVLEIIRTSLSLPKGEIDMNSGMQNVAAWDSLGHLGILVALDKAFDKKVAAIQEMATADSVRKILDLLAANGLI